MMRSIHTLDAPQAIGPYSQAIEFGEFIFTSGQIPLLPSGELVEANIEKQTHQVLQNLQSILQAANSNLDCVIKVSMFIKDLNQFEEINRVYNQYFINHKPARTCVEISRLPKDVLIEIEVIAKKANKN